MVRAFRGMTLVGLVTVSLVGASAWGGAGETPGSGWERLGFDASSGLAWASGIDDVAWVGGSRGQRIPWVGDRFVAVGSIVPRVPEVLVEQARQAMWLSRDGLRWNEVPPDALPVGIEFLRTPVAFGGKLFVFGVDATGGLAAWRSSERGVWQRSALTGAAAEWPSVDGAFVWDGQLVAYGSAGRDLPTMWTSRDGEVWSPWALPGSAASVVASPDGRRLVALVRVPNEATRSDVIFVSADGISWTRTAQLGASVEPGSETLAVRGQSLWAATYPGTTKSRRRPGSLWRSRDGIDWRRSGNAPRAASIDQLIPVGHELVATGFDNDQPGAWTSMDARRWVPMDVYRPAGGRLNRAATNGRIVVAFSTAPELRDYYRWERQQSGSDRPSSASVRRGDPAEVPLPQVEVPGDRFDEQAWRTMWATTPGSTADTCVAVDDETEVRSGEFVVGNFASFVSGWDGTYETSKLYYIPLHPDVPAWPDDTQPLHVRAELLDGASEHRVDLAFPGFALGDGGALFYVTGTVLPEAGTWRLRATAGRNTGCFLVTV